MEADAGRREREERQGTEDGGEEMELVPNVRGDGKREEKHQKVKRKMRRNTAEEVTGVGRTPHTPDGMFIQSVGKPPGLWAREVRALGAGLMGEGSTSQQRRSDTRHYELDKYCFPAARSPLPGSACAWLPDAIGAGLAAFLLGSECGGLEGPEGPWGAVRPRGSWR
ncbi:hypothetical protein EYF80_057722 [Liparis tanakae]|uniref:Uncharacterized protein n=1 Tax=Liparis tanakae TaxID=230148 RepID=A0A4Z2EU08_9TELE|nr:hypothetical protein EYF80_057722 [Liparis tanakae]